MHIRFDKKFIECSVTDRIIADDLQLIDVYEMYQTRFADNAIVVPYWCHLNVRYRKQLIRPLHSVQAIWYDISNLFEDCSNLYRSKQCISEAWIYMLPHDEIRLCEPDTWGLAPWNDPESFDSYNSSLIRYCVGALMIVRNGPV